MPHADVTFFVGENGAGKSTILEAIAVGMGLPSEGGNRDVVRKEQDRAQLIQLLRDYRWARLFADGHASAQVYHAMTAAEVTALAPACCSQSVRPLHIVEFEQGVAQGRS